MWINDNSIKKMTVLLNTAFQISTSVLRRATLVMPLLTLFAITQMDRLSVSAKMGSRRMAPFVKVKHTIIFIVSVVYSC